MVSGFICGCLIKLGFLVWYGLFVVVVIFVTFDRTSFVGLVWFVFVIWMFCLIELGLVWYGLFVVVVIFVLVDRTRFCLL